MAVIRQDICLQFIKWIFMSAVPSSSAFIYLALLFCSRFQSMVKNMFCIKNVFVSGMVFHCL